MTSRIRLALSVLLLAAVPLAATAQPPFRHGPGHEAPGRHPHYLRALSDLRSARWLLSHHSYNRAEARDEEAAVVEIEKAIHEITAAAITDGKDLNAPVGIDVPPERGGRLHRVQELLEQVRGDVNREEDDPFTRGLRNRAVLHVNQAIRFTQKAIADKHFGGPPHPFH